MPDIDYFYLPEGEPFNANSLNTRFNTVTNGVNDLMDYSAVRGAFHEDHLPSLVPGLGVPLTVSVKIGTTFSTQYNAFNSNTGWEVIANGGTDLAITFASISLGMTHASKIAGLYVLMNTQWLGAQPLGGAITDSVWAAFCIQWSSDLVTWNTISRTERFIAGQGLAPDDKPLPGASVDPSFPEATAHQDVAIRTLILPSDIAPGTTIRGVRGAIAWYDDNAPVGNVNVSVNASTLTVLPFHAKEMP